MFERFSDRARRSVELAQSEATRLGHGHVGTEHLLLGVLAEGPSPASDALVAAGATLHGCREMAAEAVGDSGPAGDPASPAFTERAKRALERAARVALRRRDAHVETAHILASVLDVEGRAGQVLRGLSVDVVALRRAVDAPTDDAPAPTAPTPGGPECANCGHALESALAHRVVTSRDSKGATQAMFVAYCASCGAAIGAAPTT